MKIFLAGATGAIGRHLVPTLIAAGHQVQAMTRNAARSDDLRDAGANPVIADALDTQSVREAVVHANPDVLIHELTSIGTTNTRDMRGSFAATNRLRTEGTDNLIAAAKAAGVRRLIAQSNITIYEAVGSAIKSENASVAVSGPSDIRANHDALTYLEAAVAGAGMEFVILRYGWLYGPGTSLAVGAQTLEAIRLRRFPLLGDGGGVWSFVHVGDAASATALAVDRGGGVYNIVDDDPATVAEWLPEIASQLGARPPFRVPRLLGALLAGPGGVELMTNIRGASNAKAKRELGWNPEHRSWRDSLVCKN